MSECQRIAEAIAASRGEPSEQLERQIEAHLEKCPACAGEVESLRRALAEAGAPPEVDDARWEGLWRRVEERVLRRKSSRRLLRALWSGAAVTAAAAAVIVAAYVFTPETQRQAPAVVTGEFQVVSLEMGSPDYDVTIMLARDDGAPPVIWLQRL